MAYLTDNAIVLRVTDFSETSQIAALFTQQYGLLPLLAKGAKRAVKDGTGKMSGPLDLLMAGEVLFLPPKSGELGTLCGWQLTNQRNALRRELAAIHAGFVAAEVTLVLLQPHDPHGELFPELEAALTLFGTAERPRALVAYAKAALISAGYSPQLAACVGCQVTVMPGGSYHYSPVAGGVMCARCYGESRKGGKGMGISGRIALALERLAAPTALLSNIPERPADAAALQIALFILLFHIEAVANRALRTRGVLGSIFGAG